MSFNEMSFNEMSFDEISFDEMSLHQKKRKSFITSVPVLFGMTEPCLDVAAMKRRKSQSLKLKLKNYIVPLGFSSLADSNRSND